MAKGFAKGILACSAIFLFMLTMVLKFTMIAEINTAFIPKIPSILTQQITTGLFEESHFRGLLITAMLIKWSDTAKRRVAVVLLSGIVFGAAHLTGLLNGNDVNTVLINALGTGLIGIGYAAVYLYSGNLLSCMFIHAVYDIAAHMSGGLIAAVWGGTLYNILHMAQPVLLYAVIPLFAVLISVKLKPFGTGLRQIS
ncbi:MAG: CPBP family intramembrane metalloprotease [Oscillospiraceae bacterium]|nr:CPBP family intramembrane metalloprotease [Oscillospiraceae bacterium]